MCFFLVFELFSLLMKFFVFLIDVYLGYIFINDYMNVLSLIKMNGLIFGYFKDIIFFFEKYWFFFFKMCLIIK